jgi:hypothetical protein
MIGYIVVAIGILMIIGAISFHEPFKGPDTPKSYDWLAFGGVAMLIIGAVLIGFRV